MSTMLTAPLAAQTARWAEAKCDLKPGHHLVNSGLNFLKSASNTRFEDQRQKDLRDAERLLNQAVTTGGQEKNPAAWYYLGRYYILTNDAVGVDTAFTRAEGLKPDCKDDIGLWRRVVWVPTFNAGIAAWQANNTDSAIVSFRRANAMLPDEPTGFKYLATLLYQKGTGPEPDTAAFASTCRVERARANPNTAVAEIARDCGAYAGGIWQEYKTAVDSAVVYFRRSATVAAKDPKFAQERKDALFNLARIEQSQRHLAEAEATYREYLGLYPNDPEVLTALGSVYMQRGSKDSAFAIYKQVIARADSMGYYSLLRAGVEISQSVPEEPDTAAAGRDCRTAPRGNRPPLTAARIRARCDSVTAGMAKAFEASSQEAFALSAQALDASLKLNPYYRETLIHRANTALGQRDPATALELSRRLIAIDPMNKQSIQIMAYAQRASGKIDSTLHYLRMHDSTLLADVTISQFDSTDGGKDVKGLVTNPRATASPTLSFVFEFVNAKGEVVATETVQVPAIQPEQSQVIEIHPKGAGIVAWRYKKG
jgi:tetratricopeptide (TPR) repeat protein